MAHARPLLTALSLVLALAGCGGAQRPEELAGLWSAGPAACAAGVGVQFGDHAIAAVYESQHETLFDRPRYQVEGEGADFRVRILYDLPHRPGGARSTGAHGVLVLKRGANGVLSGATHNLVDPRTGSARLRIDNDPALSAMSLEPCGAHPWRETLRGRRDV